MSKYPPEALEPENLAFCIDELGKKINQLEQTTINDEQVGIFGLAARLDELEKQLKAAVELHQHALEEQTEQIGEIIKTLKFSGLNRLLARLGL